MTTMQQVALICPNCRSRLTVQALMSTNFVGMTTEFRRLTSGFDPWELMIHSCQKCGFTGGEGEFKGEVDPSVSEKIRQHIFPHVRDERLSADTRWEFAALIAEWRAEDPLTVAGLYHNAVWCARGGEREFYLRRRTADWLERAIEDGVADDPPFILYLIGEMYRRCGETEVAHKYYDAAMEAADGPDAERLRKLASRQKSDPQEVLN